MTNFHVILTEECGDALLITYLFLLLCLHKLACLCRYVHIIIALACLCRYVHIIIALACLCRYVHLGNLSTVDKQCLLFHCMHRSIYIALCSQTHAWAGSRLESSLHIATHYDEELVRTIIHTCFVR